MATTRSACPSCGATSIDPVWCSSCAERIRPGDALRRGEILAIRLHVPPDQPTPTRVSSTARTEKMSAVAPEPVPSRSRRKPAAASAMTIDEAGVLGQIELIAPIGVQNGVRWWRATDKETGRGLRIEESDDDIENVGIPALPAIVDVPVGATQVRELRIRAFRDVGGQSMFERLRELGRVLSPTELGEWLEPVVAALDLIHDAGYVCLRLSPWTITYRDDGSVYLRHVDGLFRPSIPTDELPAITGFAAPETYQLATGEMPTAAADIYAVGALAWFLAARRPPPVAQRSQWLPIVPPRDIEPAFAVGIEPFLRAAMHPDPTRRPRTCRELAAMLHDAVDMAEFRATQSRPVFTTVASETHIGVTKRLSSPVNQDAVFAASTEDGQLSLLAVADGVSTASWGSGDLASGIAMERLRRAWDELLEDPDGLLGDDPGAWLDGVLQQANREIVAWVDAHFSPFSGDPSEVMATTFVAALIRGSRVYCVSIGDSSLFLIHGRAIERVTREHNMLTLGLIEGHSPQQLLNMPWHQALAQCLGAFDVDRERHLNARDVALDHVEFGVVPGDRLVLCSDGLIDFLAREQRDAVDMIVAMTSAEPLPDLLALEFIVAANRGGGGDNIGVAIAALERDPIDVSEVLAERRSTEYARTDGYQAVE